ncbi:MAG: YfhO family protein [Deltaproteobacteria bacterium]|nr:MAG: YfhO family protein [Deltaproteobacteria bacterium]
MTTARRERLLAGLLLIVPLLALLWTSLVGDAVLSGADVLFATPFFAERAPPGFTRPANPLAFDVAYQFVPWRHFAWESVRRGELPLWNPYSLAGTPFIASMQSAVFYPINLLLTAAPFARTFAWSALARLWIAGFSTYLLARFHGVSRTGALVAGLSFMLCGYMIVWLGHPHTNVAVWLPALVLAGERLRAAESGARRMRAVALLAALVGIQFTGGHIETSVDVLFCLGAYYGLRWWQGAGRRQLALLLLPALAVALGTALAAVQLLPFLEWLPLSAEYQRRLPAGIALFDPRSWHEVLALPLVLFPNLYGNPTWPGPYRSYLPWGNYNENVLHVGTVALLCALVALCLRREPASPVRALALLALIAAGMAFHLPVLDWLNALPGLAHANPARLRLVMSFGLAVLAGFGFDAVLDGGPGRRCFVRLAVAVVAAGALLAAAGNLLLPHMLPRLTAWGRHVVDAKYAALPAPAHALEYYHEELDAVVAGMVAAFRLGNLAMYAPAVVALGGWLLARGSARGPILVVLLAAELVGLGRGYTPAVPLRDFYPTTPAASRLAGDRTLHRVTALGEDLVPDAHMMYGLADVRGLDFPTRWYAAYLDAAGRLPWITYGSLLGSVESPLLRVLNVKYVVAAGEPPPRGVRSVEQYDSVHLAELARVQPRSFVVHDAVVAESDARALEILRSAPDAIYTRVVISGPADVRPVAGGGDDQVSTVAYAPTEASWSVATEAGGYLVNTDAWYPGWRAYVDGQPATLHRANLAFRAVAVPAGRHTVAFRYEPRSVRVGLALTALAGCVIVGMLVGAEVAVR